ncbi:MAG: 3-ketoacyl-acyl carrier protein reductase [Candidatus Curtissbacteria bacterium GW2011_GWA1_40_16]|uniref:3-ketoacyl-acyl carrier protein reductase n=1 Tax=Candidatus Curtissbacteria bacterium GW2011_GWA1_40_16 TaxID=1618405 RepID=A0A0G0RC55_9BACT|nr:MAG: 3-ketoacyl-acyl carrier protein reductase [Candidatus Curtissbacteria bacterium GW2011_GWA1_40_16]
MTKSKVVFIAGASRGIGLATAKKFATKGWLVAGFYNKKTGPKVKNVSWYQFEISDYSSIKKSFGKAFEDLGRVDCFINCVGIFGYKNLAEYDEQLLDKVINVNEKGVYLTTKEILNKMTDGSIVYISSTAAQIGSTDPVYAGTKSAILGLTKSMAKALAPKIRVNCVAPGVTNSDMTKNMKPERLNQLIEMSLLKRIAEPEDVASAIYFLASDESKHITGTCLDINAGYVLR